MPGLAASIAFQPMPYFLAINAPVSPFMTVCSVLGVLLVEAAGGTTLSNPPGTKGAGAVFTEPGNGASPGPPGVGAGANPEGEPKGAGEAPEGTPGGGTAPEDAKALVGSGVGANGDGALEDARSVPY